MHRGSMSLFQKWCQTGVKTGSVALKSGLNKGFFGVYWSIAVAHHQYASHRSFLLLGYTMAIILSHPRPKENPSARPTGKIAHFSSVFHPQGFPFPRKMCYNIPQYKAAPSIGPCPPQAGRPAGLPPPAGGGSTGPSGPLRRLRRRPCGAPTWPHPFLHSTPFTPPPAHPLGKPSGRWLLRGAA